MSSACNRRRHLYWPDFVGRVNGTFCFTGASYRAQLLKGRLVLNPGFFFFLQKHFFGQFSLLFLRASNHQLVDKMNYIQFTVLKAFTYEFKLCAAHVNDFSSDLVERVDFSDSRVALLWADL